MKWVSEINRRFTSLRSMCRQRREAIAIEGNSGASKVIEMETVSSPLQLNSATRSGLLANAQSRVAGAADGGSKDKDIKAMSHGGV